MPAAKGKTVTDQASGVSVTLPAVAAFPAAAAQTAQKAFYKGFQKGQSGHPGGALSLGRFYFECRKIFKEASPELARTAVDMALNPATDERVRSVLLIAGLDRAGVKPMDHDPNEDNPQPTWDPGALTAEEREDLKALLHKMMKK